MGRSPCCTKEGLNRGAWAASEDKILEAYIKAHGEGKWRNLPKKAGLKRCGKSCRLRWLNYLRPDIKRGNISHDEEDLIIRLHKLLGNRWSLIAGRLPGRTDNEIKNYWNTTLGKKANAQSSASPQSKQTSPSKCTSKKLASGPTATEHSASSPQAAPAIRTKATRCTKVVLSLESPPAALLTTDPPTPTIPSTDQPQASSLSATTDFHTCPRGPQLLNFDCPDFRASDRGVQVDDDDYHQNLYVPQQQSLPLDEPMLKDWTTGTSLEDNAGLDFDSLASFLDITEEWDILKFSSKFL